MICGFTLALEVFASLMYIVVLAMYRFAAAIVIGIYLFVREGAKAIARLFAFWASRHDHQPRNESPASPLRAGMPAPAPTRVVSRPASVGPSPSAARRGKDIRRLADIDELIAIKLAGIGFVVITDDARNARTHGPSCPCVTVESMTQKVIVNHERAGSYYWVPTIAVASAKRRSRALPSSKRPNQRTCSEPSRGRGVSERATASRHHEVGSRR